MMQPTDIQQQRRYYATRARLLATVHRARGEVEATYRNGDRDAAHFARLADAYERLLRAESALATHQETRAA